MTVSSLYGVAFTAGTFVQVPKYVSWAYSQNIDYLYKYNSLDKNFYAECVNRSNLENIVELCTFARKNNILSFLVIHTHTCIYIAKEVISAGPFLNYSLLHTQIFSTIKGHSSSDSATVSCGVKKCPMNMQTHTPVTLQSLCINVCSLYISKSNK